MLMLLKIITLSCSECQKKFGKTIGRQIWEAVNSCFDVMPLAAVVDSKVSIYSLHTSANYR